MFFGFLVINSSDRLKLVEPQFVKNNGFNLTNSPTVNWNGMSAKITLQLRPKVKF